MKPIVVDLLVIAASLPVGLPYLIISTNSLQSMRIIPLNTTEAEVQWGVLNNVIPAQTAIVLPPPEAAAALRERISHSNSFQHVVDVENSGSSSVQLDLPLASAAPRHHHGVRHDVAYVQSTAAVAVQMD